MRVPTPLLRSCSCSCLAVEVPPLPDSTALIPTRALYTTYLTHSPIPRPSRPLPSVNVVLTPPRFALARPRACLHYTPTYIIARRSSRPLEGGLGLPSARPLVHRPAGQSNGGWFLHFVPLHPMYMYTTVPCATYHLIVICPPEPYPLISALPGLTTRCHGHTLQPRERVDGGSGGTLR